MKGDKIFQEISSRANYLDPDLVRQFYLATVKTIMAELRKNGRFYLPGIGEFRITTYKKRKIGLVNTEEKVVLNPTNVIKFSACENLRVYIKNLVIDNE